MSTEMSSKASAKSEILRTIKRLTLILTGSVLMAFTLNTFVKAGELLPGGFTGLTLLIQEVCLRYFSIHIPFSVILYVLNAVPAVFCFRAIGKKFTLYSCLMIVVSGLLTDWMPRAEFTKMIMDAIQLHDNLLASVFGGILIAVSIVLCLRADATSGGTDFIAVFISEKYRKDSWNYIFAGNCVILMIAAFLFSLDRALYSIIFQFSTTITLQTLYKSYQQKTLLIVTKNPDQVYTVIKNLTNHAATTIEAMGNYEKTRRVVLYSVVSANEVNALMTAIKKADNGAFINVLKTEHINGLFYSRPKD